MPHAEHRWMLSNDMVEIFNRHREGYFLQSEWICVDESISRWYGTGGGWINIGIPVYIAIDCKPKTGCEIHNSAFGKIGVMLRLLIVKSTEELDLHTLENDECIEHGNKILKYLCLPLANTRRGVCTDSYFAPVSSAEELMKIGLRLIGVFKTATQKILMAYLSSVEFDQGRGQQVGAVLKTYLIAQMMAYAWMDCDRRYFISTASSLSDGRPYSRVHEGRKNEIMNILVKSIMKRRYVKSYFYHSLSVQRFITIHVQQLISTITTYKTHCV